MLMRYLLFVIFAVSTLLHAETGRDIVAQMLPVDALLPNAQTLGLSAGQQTQLRERLLPLQREVMPLQGQLREVTAGFVAQLSAQKPDEAAVMAKFTDVEALESKIKVLRLKMTLIAKSVLSVDQQKRAMALRGSGPSPMAGSSDTIRSKLQRVRDGIERMKRDGRDVTQVAALWAEFQKRAELRHHQLAMKALNDALVIIEGERKP